MLYLGRVPDNTGPELAYLRVANDLARRLDDGEWPGGAKLPTERALAAEYEVSYPTVRHAMAVLRDRGLVRSVHGKGTFPA